MVNDALWIPGDNPTVSQFPYSIKNLSPGHLTDPCKGVLDTSTVALRVVSGDKKGTQYPGV
jgi:hypothetical protein